MRNYEILYILRADLEDAQRAEVNSKLAEIITKNGGKVNATDETTLGLRELAYPVKEQTKGFYVILKATMGKEAIDEFNRLVSINPSVLRFLITVAHE